MQRLLEDRFHFRAHRESREVSVYIMTVAGDGHKLQATREGSCNHPDTTNTAQSLQDRPGGRPWCVITPPSRQGAKWVWDVQGMSMDVLAKLMNPGRPVLDRTGLTGTYDIHLEWWDDTASSPPDSDTPIDPPGASLIGALRKQLGLQLEPGKGPREFLRIDRLERPSEN